MPDIVDEAERLRGLLADILDAFYCRNGKTNVHLLDAIEAAESGRRPSDG